MWSNEKVIQAAQAFVPVTDEVWRLQRGSDAECRHFQTMANQGHYRAKGGTRQGVYVITSTGKLLASVNSRDPHAVLETLEKGLKGWAQTEPADRRLPADFEMQRKRWETSFPEDGLVLRTFNTDLGEGVERARRNRDHAWFSASEARAWLGATPTVGASHTVSDTITKRLVQFHLVDNIRGQTLPFAPADIQTATLTTTVTAVEGARITFRIQGQTKAATDGTWTLGTNDWTPTEKYARGVETTIHGQGTWNQEAGRMEALEFVALGTRSGRTNLNGRAKTDVGPAGIGFFVEIAPRRASERVPPAFIDIYGVDWVVDPR